MLIAIVFLIVYNIFLFLALFAFLHATIVNFQRKCMDAFIKEPITSDDLVFITKEYKMCKAALEYILLIIFPIGQLVIIFAIYYFIKSRMYWSLILASFAVVGIQYGIVHQVEIVYKQIAQIVSKGNMDAYRTMDMIKIHMMQNHVAELDQSGPLTAAGFFTVNRGLFTAMVSTTVTYILILMQML